MLQLRRTLVLKEWNAAGRNKAVVVTVSKKRCATLSFTAFAIINIALL